MAPRPGIFEACKQSIDKGFRVYLLVPDDLVLGSRQIAEWAAPGKIAVETVESFVSSNIEWLSGFKKDTIVDSFRLLLQTYNQRVNEFEPEKSLLITIPPTLQ